MRTKTRRLPILLCRHVCGEGRQNAAAIGCDLEVESGLFESQGAKMSYPFWEQTLA